ncbi:sulfiredoxin-like [Clavelina lepadiformis]|uniref:sulfiredoxin-like n=1 Tax=Clavelina lepadiformis TaxID=159417 RepID=UPI0040431100
MNRLLTSYKLSLVFPLKAFSCVSGMNMAFKDDEKNMVSIHSDHVKEFYTMPIKYVTRPLPPELDENKVKSLMDTLENPNTEQQVPPIDVLWIQGREGGNYYFSFGGCHRYEAHVRLKRENIKVKLISSTVESLQTYLGSSAPDLK